MMRLAILIAVLAIGCANGARETTSTRSPTTMATKPVTMRIDVKGTGRPLLFVGGGLTGWDSWKPHQERLATTRMVGRAQPLAVQFGLDDEKLPPDYSVKMESRALAAAIDAQFPPGPVDVTAWSYGAMFTLDYALDHPDRIRTLTLIEPPAFWVLDAAGTADDETTRESNEMHALYETMTVDVTEAQLASFVRQAGLVPPGKSPEELPAWPSWVAHRRSLRSGNAPWAHHDDVARLRAFDKPVLLVKGTGSSHFLHRILDGLAKTMPRAQMIELPGGHAPNVVAMDAFLDQMARFQR